jgi:hypothetical protein
MRVLVFAVLAACTPVGGGGTVATARQAKASPTETLLREIGAAVDGGSFDAPLLRLVMNENVKKRGAEFAAFRTRYEAKVRAEIAQRVAAKRWPRAVVLERISHELFQSRGLDSRDRWGEELAPLLDAAEKARHDGAAMILRAAIVATIRKYPESKDRAEELRTALDALRAKYRIALEIAGSDAVKAGFKDHTRFALGKRAAQKIVVTLGKPTSKTERKVGQDSVRVEQGTKSVPNPARADLEARIADKEQEMQYRRDERQMEEQSPTRKDSNLEMIDYQISVVQGELDSLRQDLAGIPATLEEPNFVDVPFDVESHTLTVSREISIEVTAPWAGELAKVRTTATVNRVDTAHGANRSLGIKLDPVELPSADALIPELDTATVAQLRTTLDTVAAQYYRSLAAGGDDGPALAIVLAPELASDADVDKVEQTTHVPYAHRVVHALTIDRLTRPFTFTPTAATTTTLAAAKPQPPTPASASKAPSPAKATSTPAHVDPLRAKAGYAWKLGTFDFKRGGAAVVSVDASGAITATTSGKRSTVVGVLRPNGIVEDRAGKAFLAIDAKGNVWDPTRTDPIGKYANDKLAFTDGATLAVEARGHVTHTYGGKTRVTEASVSVRAPRPAALVVAWLAMGALGLK